MARAQPPLRQEGVQARAVPPDLTLRVCRCAVADTHLHNAGDVEDSSRRIAVTG